MKIVMGLALLVWTLMATGAPADSALLGRWSGELKVGTITIPLVFCFVEGEGETTLCTLYSPQQSDKGVPMTVDYISSDSIALTSAALGVTFRGCITSTEIVGGFTQQGYTFPLSLRPEEPLSVRRPQTPRPPFPYKIVDTTFVATDGMLLSGTLTIPDKPVKDKKTMVVMITGSGPQNRDEEFFDHRPFAVIADCLARNGVASFRYDDRGIAESKGNFNTSTTYTFKDDAAAALKFVRSVEGVGAVGVLGHSEGGSIALMLAEENLTDFIVSLAGMAISGEETILDQNRHMMELLGFDEQKVDECMKVIGAVFKEIIIQMKENRRDGIDVDAIAKDLGVTVPSVIMQSLKANVDKRTDFFNTFLTVDPSEDLGKIKCPVLALNGTLDTQVNASKNLAAIRQGVKQAEIHELEGLNHLFQHAVTGEMSEYVNIQETISPDVLALIVAFLSHQ